MFDNDFTFFRGQEAKSQIDLSMTNDRGRKYIECFKTLQHKWHLSDHKPITLRLRLQREISLSGLLTRAIDLNYMPNDISHEIVQLKGNYNYEKITEELELAKEELPDLVNVELRNNSIDTALDILDTRIREIHKRNKNKRVEIRHKSDRMEDANKAFDNYMNALDDPTSSEPILNEKFERYMLARKALNSHAISEETRKWNNVIRE